MIVRVNRPATQISKILSNTKSAES